MQGVSSARNPNIRTTVGEASMNFLKSLLSDYHAGCGYRKGQYLKPRQGAKVHTYEIKDSVVAVLDQCPLAPHQYTVIGERENPKTPSDRFVKFEINGHDWEPV